MSVGWLLILEMVENTRLRIQSMPGNQEGDEYALEMANRYLTENSQLQTVRYIVTVSDAWRGNLYDVSGNLTFCRFHVPCFGASSHQIHTPFGICRSGDS